MTRGMSDDRQRRASVPGHPGIYRSSSGNFEIAYRTSDRRVVYHVCDGLCGTGLAAADKANSEIRELRQRVVLLGNTVTFAEARDRWQEQTKQRVAAGTLNPSTVERNARALDQLMPLLDSPKRARRRLLRDIFPHTVDGLLGKLEEQGVPKSSRQLAVAVLRSVLEESVTAGLVSYNAADELRRSARLAHADARRRARTPPQQR